MASSSILAATTRQKPSTQATDCPVGIRSAGRRTGRRPGDCCRGARTLSCQGRLAFAKEFSANYWSTVVVPLGREFQVRNDFRSKTEMVFHSPSRSWSRTCSQVSTSFGLRSCASTRRRISSSCSGETATGSDSMLFHRDSTIRNRSETGNVVSSDIVCCKSTALLTSI